METGEVGEERIGEGRGRSAKSYKKRKVVDTQASLFVLDIKRYLCITRSGIFALFRKRTENHYYIYTSHIVTNNMYHQTPNKTPIHQNKKTPQPEKKKNTIANLHKPHTYKPLADYKLPYSKQQATMGTNTINPMRFHYT